MMKARFLQSTFFASFAFAIAGGQLQAQDEGILTPHQHRPISVRRVHDDQTAVDSTNWSGYAVTGPTSSVTYAAGSWIVPASTCPESASHHRATPEYAAFWVGIDGWSSNTVEQIGTDSDCSNGTPSYYAWYEMYPQASYNASCTSQQERQGTCSEAGNMTNLKPGDVISASVTYNAGGKTFTLEISDLSSGASFKITLTAKGTPQRSSAEWIAEAPSSSSAVLPLADFGSVNFGGDPTAVPLTCYATVAGVAGPASIGSFENDSAYGISLWSSTMVTNSGAAMATPSALSADGSSFSVMWNSVGP